MEAHSNLGMVLFQKGQVDEAIAQFQKALEINPNSRRTHYNLGNALFQKGQLDEAIAQYQKALEINPNYFAEAHYNLGLRSFKRANWTRLCTICNRRWKSIPTLPKPTTLLATSRQKGQLDEAIAPI